MSDASALALLDTALRAAALALLATLGLLALRGRVRQPLGRVTAALAGGLGLQLLATAPAFAARAPAALAVVLAAVSMANAVVFWLFARAWVDSGFALRRTDGAAWAAVAAASLLHCALALRGGGPAAAIAGLALGLLPLAFGGLALKTLLARRAAGDDAARGLGALIVGGGFAYALGQQLLRIASRGSRLDGPEAAFDAAALLALLALVAWRALRLDADGAWAPLAVPPGDLAPAATLRSQGGTPPPAVARIAVVPEHGVALAPARRPAPPPARARLREPERACKAMTPPLASALDRVEPAARAAAPAKTAPPASPAPFNASEASDDRLLAALEHLMASQHAYRDEGLGIAALAARLDAPEYRLRRVINRRLGHRNFSAYLNGLRLAEARAALADPARRDLSVLTIALSTGFQSIGPFNRAFKADTGLTPTEFRRQKLADS